MKSWICIAGMLMLANLSPSAKAASAATPPSVQDQIAQAVMALPPELRADATVVTYNPETGARTVLRQGTNSLECEPAHQPSGFIRCYSKQTVPRRELEAKLRAQKKTDDQIDEEVAAEIKAGKLKEPPFGTMYYRLATKPGVIKWLWVMTVPNATTESIGVSTKSQRDAALQGHGLPWLMRAGTPHAHIMIPINQ